MFYHYNSLIMINNLGHTNRACFLFYQVVQVKSNYTLTHIIYRASVLLFSPRWFYDQPQYYILKCGARKVHSNNKHLLYSVCTSKNIIAYKGTSCSSNHIALEYYVDERSFLIDNLTPELIQITQVYHKLIGQTCS